MTQNKNEIEITKDLTMINIKKISDRLLISIISGSNFNIDLSEIGNIDITGLQLLISLSKELNSLDQTLTFSGNLKENFRNDLEDLIFSVHEITTGPDLTKFIDDIK